MPKYFAPKRIASFKEYATASNHPLFGIYEENEEERANEALNLSDDEDEEGRYCYLINIDYYSQGTTNSGMLVQTLHFKHSPGN